MSAESIGNSIRPRGRPRLPGSPEKKEFLGFESSTDSEFAEILLHGTR